MSVQGLGKNTKDGESSWGWQQRGGATPAPAGSGKGEVTRVLRQLCDRPTGAVAPGTRI